MGEIILSPREQARLLVLNALNRGTLKIGGLGAPPSLRDSVVSGSYAGLTLSF